MRLIASWLSIPFLAAACLPVGSAYADDSLKGIDTLRGTCKKLAVVGKDQTADCRGVLFSTRFADRRTGFYFVTTDGTMITFSSP